MARAALPHPRALAEPDGTRPQHAPQLARSWRIHAVARPQREVLVIAGHVTGRGPASRVSGRTPARVFITARVDDPRGWEAVVRIRPRGRLRRVEPRRAHALGQPGQLVAAALPHGRERHRIPAQVQSDLIRPADTVAAGHRLHGQHGAINAT